MRKKVLVTGAAGFIGSALCKRLMHEGFAVTGLDNLSAGMRLPFGLDEHMVCKVQDLLEPHSKMPKHDVVIHLAASFANEKSVDYPVSDCSSNVVGTCAAAKLAQMWGARFIYTGSSSSYGSTIYRWGTEEVVPFREHHPAKPHTPYGLSKYQGEMYAQLFCPDALILRLFNVFGPGDPPTAYRNAIPKMIRSALETKTITVYGEASGRDFMHIDTLMDIFVGFLMRHNEAKGLYNVATGRPTYMKTVAEIIALETKADIVTQPQRSWDAVTMRIGDVTKIKELFPLQLGMAPRVGESIIPIIEYVEDWLRDNANSKR